MVLYVRTIRIFGRLGLECREISVAHVRIR